jgi:hypothetical protein
MAKEKAFRAVMEKQSQYDFLHHDKIAQSTSEEKRKLLLNIKERLERLNKQAKEKIINTMGIITMAIMMAFSLSSCDKEPIIERQLITQELTLSNIYSMPMTKGFDPTTWVYEYNTTPALITFTSVDNPAETVTQSVTIQQLMNGINVTIYAGTYNITYQTVHSTTDFTKLDIKINMQNVKVTGTPIALNGTYDDYLIILDMPDVFNIDNDYWEGYKISLTKNEDLNIWYAYSNINNPVFTFLIRFSDMSTKTFNLGGKTLGQIYWYTSPIGANTQITFPAWVINKITL